MKTGIAPPLFAGHGVYDARGLIEVEERGSQEEQRRQHEICEGDGNSDRVVGLRLQQRDESEAGDEENEYESGKRAKRVQVVGACERTRPAKCRLRAERLGDARRDDEPDVGEIGGGKERE